jgi:hypothetical protein
LQSHIILPIPVRIVKHQFEPASRGSSARLVEQQVAQSENLRALSDARQQPTLVQVGVP